MVGWGVGAASHPASAHRVTRTVPGDADTAVNPVVAGSRWSVGRTDPDIGWHDDSVHRQWYAASRPLFCSPLVDPMVATIVPTTRAPVVEGAI
jgi:hypothetical protein